jgi:hypothetical protein
MHEKGKGIRGSSKRREARNRNKPQYTNLLTKLDVLLLVPGHSLLQLLPLLFPVGGDEELDGTLLALVPTYRQESE